MSYATLEEARVGLTTALSALTGLKSVPPIAPSSPADFPFLVVRKGQYNIEPRSMGWKINYADMVIGLYTGLMLLPDTLAALADYPEQIFTIVAVNLEQNTINWKRITGGEMPAFEWGGVPCYGMEFVIHELKFPNSNL
jgi:hypothetical protein